MRLRKRWLMAAMLAGALSVLTITLTSKGSAIWFDASAQTYACLKGDIGDLNWRYEGISGPFHELLGSAHSVHVRPWVVQLRLPVEDFDTDKTPGSAIKLQDITYRLGSVMTQHFLHRSGR